MALQQDFHLRLLMRLSEFVKRFAARLALSGVAAIVGPFAARAQDPFEIHVYEYEQLPLGGFTLEGHFNYVGIGSEQFAGTAAPTQHQFHMTYELTGGITDDISLGFMLLTAARPGGSGLDYAGWRVLPHRYVPATWRLPVNLGLVAEFSFQTTTYEENSNRLELRGIVEKKIRRVQLDFNPVFERALHGPGVNQGWSFEPAFRAAYELNEHFSPSLEYYSSYGAIPSFLPLNQQIHQIYPGGDWKLTKNLLWSFGIGVGLTSTGERLIYKTRLEYSLAAKLPLQISSGQFCAVPPAGAAFEVATLAAGEEII
jgi:hypothetical protein